MIKISVTIYPINNVNQMIIDTNIIKDKKYIENYLIEQLKHFLITDKEHEFKINKL